MVFGCVFFLYCFQDGGRIGFGFFYFDGQVVQDGVVEFEIGFDFSQCFVVDFDVQVDVVSFGQFLDLVSQLVMILIFDMVDFVVVGGDDVFVMFDYCWYLFVLVWVDDKYDFIMMYVDFLWIY